MYAYAYARVSTEEQDLDTQIAAVEEWARKNNVTILEWFVDHGISGATPLQERPGFRKLLEKLKTASPRPSLLLVYDVTRIARSLREFLLAWNYIENTVGLALIPVKDIHIFQVPYEYRDILKTLLATFAELEREFIRRRTRDAMRRLKQEGKITNIVERLLRENKQLLDTICREYREGTPKYRLAKSYKLSLYAVERILREYCGVVYEGTCPRCMHMLRLERRSVEFTDGSVKVRLLYYCPNCGFTCELEESS